MGIKQHFVTLAGVGSQPEGAAGAQLHVREPHAMEDAADHHAFFAPVELESFAAFARTGAPGTDESVTQNAFGCLNFFWALKPYAHRESGAFCNCAL